MSDPEEELLAGLADEPSSVERAIREVSAWIGDGVEGVGEGRTEAGEPCLIVFVSTLDQATRDRIPVEVNGHPVVLSTTDTFRTES